MRTLNQFVLLPALSLLAFAACKRHDEIAGPGISRRISEFESFACTGGTVTRYNFRDSQVYLFDTNCRGTDLASQVYDRDGNELCALGGIAGNVNCQGVRFIDYAANPVVVYTKP